MLTFAVFFSIMSLVITMKEQIGQQLKDSVRDFRLPRYGEIPTMGLYLEQASKYVCEYLEPLGDFSLTPSMISNYVKKGLIDSPVKKQYSREQIAYLFFIAVAKSVLSLDALTNFIALQKRTYCLQRAYDYFCDEFENVLAFTFEVTDLMEAKGEDNTTEKRLLFACIVAAVEKVYLEKYLDALTRAEASLAEI